MIINHTKQDVDTLLDDGYFGNETEHGNGFPEKLRDLWVKAMAKRGWEFDTLVYGKDDMSEDVDLIFEYERACEKSLDEAEKELRNS
jgi:hypothetical protein